jgi:hypothetical protein
LREEGYAGKEDPDPETRERKYERRCIKRENPFYIDLIQSYVREIMEA